MKKMSSASAVIVIAFGLASTLGSCAGFKLVSQRPAAGTVAVDANTAASDSSSGGESTTENSTDQKSDATAADTVTAASN